MTAYILVLLCIFILSFAAGRSGWLRDRSEVRLEDRNPFQFLWIPSDKGGRWALKIAPSSFESFLLVKQLDPPFQGISSPEIISSKSKAEFLSDAFDEVIGISTNTMSSYARLSDIHSQKGRLAVHYPLEGCGLIVQSDGMTELGSTPTHQVSAGMVHAVDIKAKMGTAVVAARGGRVVFAEDRYPDSMAYDTAREKLDNRVIILHEDGTEGLYAHLMTGSVVIQEGDTVAAGDRLASVGSSGYSENPHLHFHVGGLNLSGYHTLPVEFEIGTARSTPSVGQSYCNASHRY